MRIILNNWFTDRTCIKRGVRQGYSLLLHVLCIAIKVLANLIQGSPKI